MIESYLRGRNGLVKVVQLVDIRHVPSGQDVQMYDYLRYYNLDGIVVATKADKVSRSELPKCISVIRKTLSMSAGDKIIPVSTLKRTGYEDLLLAIGALLNSKE
jgi:GTP-binding protein